MHEIAACGACGGGSLQRQAPGRHKGRSSPHLRSGCRLKHLGARLPPFLAPTAARTAWLSRLRTRRSKHRCAPLRQREPPPRQGSRRRRCLRPTAFPARNPPEPRQQQPQGSQQARRRAAGSARCSSSACLSPWTRRGTPRPGRPPWSSQATGGPRDPAAQHRCFVPGRSLHMQLLL